MAKFTLERIKNITTSTVKAPGVETFVGLSRVEQADLLKAAVKAANQRIVRLERSRTGADTSEALRTRSVDYRSGKHKAELLKYGKVDETGHVRFSYNKDITDKRKLLEQFAEIQRFLNMSTSTTEGARRAYERSKALGFDRELLSSTEFKKFEEIYNKLKETPTYEGTPYIFKTYGDSDRIALMGEFKKAVERGEKTESDLLKAMRDFVDDYESKKLRSF